MIINIHKFIKKNLIVLEKGSTSNLQNTTNTLNYYFYPLHNKVPNFEKMIIIDDPISLLEYLKNNS